MSEILFNEKVRYMRFIFYDTEALQEAMDFLDCNSVAGSIDNAKSTEQIDLLAWNVDTSSIDKLINQFELVKNFLEKYREKEGYIWVLAP